jgi:hypothetical protein
MKLLLMKLLCSLIRPYGRGVNEALTQSLTHFPNEGLERTFRTLELALYHSLGKLPEPESTTSFSGRKYTALICLILERLGLFHGWDDVRGVRDPWAAL